MLFYQIEPPYELRYAGNTWLDAPHLLSQTTRERYPAAPELISIELEQILARCSARERPGLLAGIEG